MCWQRRYSAQRAFKAVYRAARLQSQFLLEVDAVIDRYRENIPSVVPWDDIHSTIGDLYLADVPPRMKEAALYAIASTERLRPFGE